MSVSIDGTGSLIGVDQGLNIVGLTTLTGGIILDDSISHIGDTDTKIRFPAADTFTIETGGTEALRIGSDQKVYFGDFASAGSKAYIEKEVSGDYKLNIHASSSTTTNRIITFNSREDVEALRIDAAGRLLLGTTTEGESNADDLTIATSAHTGMTIRSGTANRGNIYFSDGTSGDAEYRGYVTYDHDGDKFKFGTANADRLVITSTGQLLHGVASNSVGYNLVTSGNNYHSILVGSTNGATASLILDGAANGDGSGSDYGSIEHFSNGEMRYKNRQNSGSGGAGHVFYTTSSDTERLRITSGGIVDVTGKLRINISNGGTAGSGAAEGIFLRNTQETDNNAVTIFGGADDYNTAASAINFINVDHSANAGDISFDTRSTSNSYAERLRITSGGFIGAGTANPRRHFHLHNSATATVGFQMTNGGTGESNDSQGFQLKVGNDGHAEIAQMENSNLRIFTNASERVRIHSGGVVSFNNGIELGSGLDGTAANTLDDYEEGTSTVSIQHITADTNEVYMTYTKIGSLVCIVGVITITNKTSSSGTNGWFALPFAPSSHNTSKPGCSIQMNTINTSVAYLGFYGNNTNCYFNSLSGGYQNGNSLGNGKIGFTATYTTH